MSELLQTIQSIYVAFGRSDVATILDALADDVQWEAWADNRAQEAGVTWMQPRQGKPGALAFFQLAGQMQMHDFQVLSMMAGGKQVVVEVVIDVTPPNGARYRDEELHLWTFNEEGKVSRLRHYVDTAKHIAAAVATSSSYAPTS